MGRHKSHRNKKKETPWYYQDQTGRLKGQPRKEKAVGYCHNPSHKGYLSLKVYKQHKCAMKECRYFEKYEDCPYWLNRKRIKEARKERKNGGEEIRSVTGRVVPGPVGKENVIRGTVLSDEED